MKVKVKSSADICVCMVLHHLRKPWVLNPLRMCLINITCVLSFIRFTNELHTYITCNASAHKRHTMSNQNLVRCSIFNIQHSNFECRISNIKLNLTFKSNVEYQISNSISHSNRMSNIEYQTESNIQIECRISNIKLNPTFKSNVEYRISN